MRTILLFLLLTSHCAAQVIVQPVIGNCYAYPVVVATLALYGEKSVAGPDLIEQTGSAVEVFISKRGTVSVVEVLASGLTCYRAFNDAEHGIGWGAQARNMTPG